MGDFFLSKRLMFTNSIPLEVLLLSNLGCGSDTIINKNSILEILQYGNTSLWWFLYPTLFPKIKTTILFLNNFNKFLDEKKPSLVIINNNFNYFEIISQICNIKKIPIKFSQKNYMKFKMKEKIIILDKIRHEKIFSQKIKTRKRVNKKRNKNRNKRNKNSETKRNYSYSAYITIR